MARRGRHVVPIEGSDRIEVTAWVEHDQLLRWWLLAFGKRVEVREPVTLREEMIAELQGAMGAYAR